MCSIGHTYIYAYTITLIFISQILIHRQTHTHTMKWKEKFSILHIQTDINSVRDVIYKQNYQSLYKSLYMYVFMWISMYAGTDLARVLGRRNFFHYWKSHDNVLRNCYFLSSDENLWNRCVHWKRMSEYYSSYFGK